MASSCTRLSIVGVVVSNSGGAGATLLAADGTRGRIGLEVTVGVHSAVDEVVEDVSELVALLVSELVVLLVTELVTELVSLLV